MNKTSRLALITTLCQGLPGAVTASEKEVSEEVALVSSKSDDPSTLDENQNLSVISPLLSERVGEIGEKYGDEELSFTKAERKEMGKASLVKFKPVQVVTDEDEDDFKAFKKAQGWEG